MKKLNYTRYSILRLTVYKRVCCLYVYNRIGSEVIKLNMLER